MKVLNIFWSLFKAVAFPTCAFAEEAGGGEGAATAGSSFGDPGAGGATPTPGFGQTPEPGAPPAQPQNQMGNQPQGNWYDSLPGDMRENQGITKYTSVEELVKGHLEAQKLIGQKQVGLVPLKEGATDEERSAHQVELNKMLGVPEAADKYTVADGMNKEGLKPVMDILHKANVGDDQFQIIAQELASLEAKNQEQFDTEKSRIAQENIKAMKAKWGSEYQANLEAATAAYQALGYTEDSPFGKLMHDVDGFTDPAMMEHFHKLSTLFGESGFKGGDHQGHKSQLDSVNEQIAELRKDKRTYNPSFDRGVKQAELEALIQRRTELQSKV